MNPRTCANSKLKVYISQLYRGIDTDAVPLRYFNAILIFWTPLLWSFLKGRKPLESQIADKLNPKSTRVESKTTSLNVIFSNRAEWWFSTDDGTSSRLTSAFGLTQGSPDCSLMRGDIHLTPSLIKGNTPGMLPLTEHHPCKTRCVVEEFEMDDSRSVTWVLSVLRFRLNWNNCRRKERWGK